ncbi:MAG TPA: hypothetical protein VIL87_02030 [Dermatophilaceae bacterium]
MDPRLELSAAPAVRRTPETAASQARELARACWPWLEGREQDTMLWTVLAERVRWNPGDVDTRPGEFTVGEFLSDLQHLMQVVQSMRYARDGVPDPEPTERDVRNVLELLLTAGRDDPVLQALAAGVAANSPMRAAAFRRFGSRRRFKQAVESSAPAIRDVHRRLRETIAGDPRRAP